MESSNIKNCSFLKSAKYVIDSTEKKAKTNGRAITNKRNKTNTGIRNGRVIIIGKRNKVNAGIRK
jgi:hypothetical protein